MATPTLLETINPEIAQIEQIILRDVQTEIPLLTRLAEYILHSGGKRLRPALVVLGAKLYGEAGPAVMRAAQVVEYLHTATLLHDDVVDQADLRRAKKAARQIWGNAASVLVGDFLFAKAFHLLTALRRIELLQVMSQTTTLMAKGEILQLTRPPLDTNEATYSEIIFYKTASLFASAIKMGAILGGASFEDQQSLYEYGKAIGLAFQMVDDSLDYDDQGQTGKPLGIDLQERKITLPLLHLLQRASAPERARILEILEAPRITNEHIREVMGLMRQHRGIESSLAVAQHYADQAKNCLEQIPASPIREVLIQIADFIVVRRT